MGWNRGGRDAAIGALTTALGTLLIALGTNPAGATAPSAPIDRSLPDYVIFATDMIHSKGSNANFPIKTQFLGGSVGINNTGELAGSPRMTVCNADDHPILMDNNTQLNADSMKLTAGCNVWD